MCRFFSSLGFDSSANILCNNFPKRSSLLFYPHFKIFVEMLLKQLRIFLNITSWLCFIFDSSSSLLFFLLLFSSSLPSFLPLCLPLFLPLCCLRDKSFSRHQQSMRLNQPGSAKSDTQTLQHFMLLDQKQELCCRIYITSSL